MAGNKGIVPSNFYTFDAANQTITFSNDYAGLDLGEITYITNIKNGVATVIYDPFDATKGGTLSGLTLTLAYNTTAMDNTDPLQVITGFTPLNPDPTPVKIVANIHDEDQIEILQNISDNLDLLSKTVDQTEGIEVNVREKNPPRRDANNAQVTSDAPTPIVLNFTSTIQEAIIDTTGYNLLVVNITGNTGWNGTINVQGRNDVGLPWTAIGFNYSSGGTSIANINTQISISVGASTIIMIPAYTRFIRLLIGSYTGGTAYGVAYLRNSPLATGVFAPGAVNSNVNITQYNSTAVATAQQVDAAGNLASAGNFAIGSSYVGTTNRPNAASSLATGVPYPISIGGREQPYIGALAGIFRHITVDGGGRQILGADTPDTETRFQSKLASGAIPGIPPRGVGARSNNMVGAQSLTVADTNQDFGDTQVMLLRQILTELKILNQQFAEMPNLLNQANFTMSDPQEYRNDGDFDSSLQ